MEAIIYTSTLYKPIQSHVDDMKSSWTVYVRHAASSALHTPTGEMYTSGVSKHFLSCGGRGKGGRQQGGGGGCPLGSRGVGSELSLTSRLKDATTGLWSLTP